MIFQVHYQVLLSLSQYIKFVLYIAGLSSENTQRTDRCQQSIFGNTLFETFCLFKSYESIFLVKNVGYHLNKFSIQHFKIKMNLCVKSNVFDSLKLKRKVCSTIKIFCVLNDCRDRNDCSLKKLHAYKIIPFRYVMASTTKSINTQLLITSNQLVASSEQNKIFSKILKQKIQLLLFKFIVGVLLSYWL